MHFKRSICLILAVVCLVSVLSACQSVPKPDETTAPTSNSGAASQPETTTATPPSLTETTSDTSNSEPEETTTVTEETTSENEDTETTTSNTQTSTSSSEETTEAVTEPTTPSDYFGISSNMFEGTAGRVFDFSIVRGDERYEFTPDFKVGDIKCEFKDSVQWGTDEVVFPAPVYPEDTATWVYTTPDIRDQFVIAVVNETDEIIPFEEGRLIYFSCAMAEDWTLFGTKIGMTQDEVLEVLGEPTQTVEIPTADAWEYYVLKDGHAYVLVLLMDKADGRLSQITLNIDNYAVFG